MIVQLRQKKSSKGKTSLYLAFWNPDAKYQVTRGKSKGQWKSGRWEYEFLKLYLVNDKNKDKETLRRAENIKNKRQLELQNIRYGFKLKFASKGNFIKYFEAMKEKLSQKRSDWNSTLSHVKKFTGGDIGFREIDREWIEDFRNYLLEKVSRNSASIYFTILKQVLRMAVKDEILTKEPGMDVNPITMVEVKKIYLTYAEIKKLLETPCPHEDFKWSFLFGCFTGLRISDLRRLTWGDIQRDGTGYMIEFRQKKTKGLEYLPLCQSAVNFLNMEEAKNADDKIFKIPNRKRAGQLFDLWTSAAGIKKHVRFHTARHTFATLCLSYGVDLYTLSKLLGHRDIKATQVYANVIDKKKREAVAMLPALDFDLIEAPQNDYCLELVENGTG